MSRRVRLATGIARAIAGPQNLAGLRQALGAVSVRVDDGPGWTNLGGTAYDRDWSEMQKLYADALEAWRKNPIAKRTIDITTDYVVGDAISIGSPDEKLDDFIARFWNHPKNRMALRLEGMCEELARAGDLFVVLFRNPADGLSYIRFVPKDRIQRIETATNDWETELVYYETQEAGEPRAWYSPAHGSSRRARAVMLHYSVNRPIGALMGESDLATTLPWLLRYSRMLEDRVRLHWAIRSFLWFVRVPTQRVEQKQEQYRTPPAAGAVVVHDDNEEWEVKTPLLRAGDASHDLEAVRRMIYAGGNHPPHWFGEPGQNLAEAHAMQEPAERHLKRRQNYFVFMLCDILFHAYQRSAAVTGDEPPAEGDYKKLFTVGTPDMSRRDNRDLAQAGHQLALAYGKLAEQLPAASPTFTGLMLKALFKFLGEPQSDEAVEEIVGEAFRDKEKKSLN